MDAKAILDLRTKYSGELARLEERKKSLDVKKTSLMKTLGISSLDSVDIKKEISDLESKIEELSQSLQVQIDNYKKEVQQ